MNEQQTICAKHPHPRWLPGFNLHKNGMNKRIVKTRIAVCRNCIDGISFLMTEFSNQSFSLCSFLLVFSRHAKCAVNKQAVIRFEDRICNLFPFIAVIAPKENKWVSLQNLCSSRVDGLHWTSALFVKNKKSKWKPYWLLLWLHSSLVLSICPDTLNYLHFKP